MSLFAKISKIPKSLLFPRSNHQLSTVYVWLCFQLPKVKTAFYYYCCLLLNVLPHLPNDTLYLQFRFKEFQD